MSSKGYSGAISLVTLSISAGLVAFVFWAYHYQIDQVARASGEVIAASRVQIIQAVDGGVLEALNVREGDRVAKGDVIATLDQSRVGAAVKEIEARLSALEAKAARLRAEVTGAPELMFPDAALAYPELVEVERALFEERISGFNDEQTALKSARSLAREEAALLERLNKSGDVNYTELIKAKRAVNDSDLQLVRHRNEFFEEARADLTRVEDEIAQNEQILSQRIQQLEDSVIISNRNGIVKNIAVTTVGGVLRAGEELMQIVPIDDALIIETKIRPEDISQVAEGQSANIRLDPFDYTIFGSIDGRVSYVSVDTLKEEGRNGEEIYYRAHVEVETNPVKTKTGRVLEILPGMTAQVDIRSGERTLFEYLMKPVIKTVNESFGER